MFKLAQNYANYGCLIWGQILKIQAVVDAEFTYSIEKLENGCMCQEVVVYPRVAVIWIDLRCS